MQEQIRQIIDDAIDDKIQANFKDLKKDIKNQDIKIDEIFHILNKIYIMIDKKQVPQLNQIQSSKNLLDNKKILNISSNRSIDHSINQLSQSRIVEKQRGATKGSLPSKSTHVRQASGTKRPTSKSKIDNQNTCQNQGYIRQIDGKHFLQHLKNTSLKDIISIKNLKNPPYIIKAIFDAVFIIVNNKKHNSTWEDIQSFLSEKNLLLTLQNLDYYIITQKNLLYIKNHFQTQQEWNYESVKSYSVVAANFLNYLDEVILQYLKNDNFELKKSIKLEQNLLKQSLDNFNDMENMIGASLNQQNDEIQKQQKLNEQKQHKEKLKEVFKGATFDQSIDHLQVLKKIKKLDIVELKNLHNTSKIVEFCLQAVFCLVKNQKTKFNLRDMQQELSDEFVQKIKNFNILEVQQEIIDYIKVNYVQKPLWDMDELKLQSQMTYHLSDWLRRVLWLQKNNQEYLIQSLQKIQNTKKSIKKKESEEFRESLEFKEESEEENKDSQKEMQLNQTESTFKNFDQNEKAKSGDFTQIQRYSEDQICKTEQKKKSENIDQQESVYNQIKQLNQEPLNQQQLQQQIKQKYQQKQNQQLGQYNSHSFKQDQNIQQYQSNKSILSEKFQQTQNQQYLQNFQTFQSQQSQITNQSIQQTVENTQQKIDYQTINVPQQLLNNFESVKSQKTQSEILELKSNQDQSEQTVQSEVISKKQENQEQTDNPKYYKYQKIIDKLQSTVDRHKAKQTQIHQFVTSNSTQVALQLIDQDIIDNYLETIKINIEQNIDVLNPLFVIFRIILNESPQKFTSDEFVKWCSNYFQNDINSIQNQLQSINPNDISIKNYIKIQKLIERNKFIQDIQTYENIDSLCGVIQFFVTDVCKYLAIIPDKSKSSNYKKQNDNMILRKLEYYKDKINNLKN